MEERRRSWLIFLAMIVALMLFFSLRGRRFGSGEITPIAARKPAPNMVLQQMDGDDWKLQDHRGEVVLINLWATWCGPCREETPGLVQLYETMHSRGLEIVGLSLDTGGREKVQSFVRQFQVPYTVAFPEPMSQLADTLEGVPTTILIDKQGRVAKTYVGAMSQQVFAADVEALLKEG